MTLIETARLVVVDDHPLLAFGLKAQLERGGIAVIIVDPNESVDLVAEILDHEANMVLVDLELPFNEGGLGLTKALVAADRRVAVLTGSVDRMLWARCLEAGALVVLAKDEPLEDLIEMVQQLTSGHQVRPHQRAELIGEYKKLEAERADLNRGFSDLSNRESTVLGGLMEGLSPTKLAERDFVSVQTVRSQVKSVLHKLGVNSQLAAVARAYEAGWSSKEKQTGR